MQTIGGPCNRSEDHATDRRTMQPIGWSCNRSEDHATDRMCRAEGGEIAMIVVATATSRRYTVGEATWQSGLLEFYTWHDSALRVLPPAHGTAAELVMYIYMDQVMNELCRPGGTVLRRIFYTTW
jgi:hypothetical protein